MDRFSDRPSILHAGSRRQGVAAAATVAWLILFAGAVADYRRAPALALAGAAVLTLAVAARRPWVAPIVAALLLGAAIWAAFFTVAGAFALNRTRLDRIVAEIDDMPGLRSMSVGQEDEYASGSGSVRFDSYRFINGSLVTLHRRQVAPTAAQPILYADDVLHRLGTTRRRYDALRASLARLSLAGFARGPGGEIRLSGPVQAAPWSTEFVHRPDGRSPDPRCVMEQRRLDAHWFRIVCG